MNTPTILFTQQKDANIREDVGDFLRGDEKGLDWKWSILGKQILSNSMKPVYGTYIHKVVVPAIRTSSDPHEVATKAQIGQLANSKGINIVDHTDKAIIKEQEQLGRLSFIKNDWLKQKVNNTINEIIPFRAPGGHAPYFNPFTNEINSPRDYDHSGALAHEYGHATGSRIHNYGNIGGKALSGLLGMGVLASKEEDTSRNFAIGSTAAYMPVIASELDASIRGASLLKKLNVPLKGRMKAFIGVPTYLLGGAFPGIAHLTKKYFGGFEKGSPSAMAAPSIVSPIKEISSNISNKGININDGLLYGGAAIAGLGGIYAATKAMQSKKKKIKENE